MIHKGVGTIQAVMLNSIAPLVLSVRGQARTVHGEGRYTAEALSAMFPNETTLIGKKIRYRREGVMLLSIAPVDA